MTDRQENPVPYHKHGVNLGSVIAATHKGSFLVNHTAYFNVVERVWVYEVRAGLR